jgi:hypothetical protein
MSVSGDAGNLADGRAEQAEVLRLVGAGNEQSRRDLSRDDRRRRRSSPTRLAEGCVVALGLGERRSRAAKSCSHRATAVRGWVNRWRTARATEV